MTAIIDAHGQLVAIIQGNAETIALNTPDGCFAVSDPPHSDMMYVDGAWVILPTRPSDHHEFDYTTKQWIDNRTLEQVKQQAWDSIKLQRDALEFDGFKFDGKIYDSDQVSQARIMGAAMAGLPQTWTAADNSSVDLSPSELIDLYATLQAHIATAHDRGRTARQAIDNALDQQEVEAVTL